MSMPKKALALFLSECSATSLKQNDELEGGLASTLQKRHKIRDTDLNIIFDRTNALPSYTFEKIYMIFQLMLYAGAAYKNFANLYNAAPGTLGAAQVLPHWDNATTYDLNSIYKYEPMNLFPGWSLTNTRNNNRMLDPHMILVNITTGTISTDLHGVVRSGAITDTGSMAIARRLSTPDIQSLDGRLSNTTVFPNRNRRNSMYSEALINNETALKNRLANINDGVTKIYALDSALRRFKILENELIATTTAGHNHYNDLLYSVQNNLGIQDPTYKALQAAQLHWNTHRTEMIDYIKQCITDLPGSGFSQVTLPRNAPH